MRIGNKCTYMLYVIATISAIASATPYSSYLGALLAFSCNLQSNFAEKSDHFQHQDVKSPTFLPFDLNEDTLPIDLDIRNVSVHRVKYYVDNNDVVESKESHESFGYLSKMYAILKSIFMDTESQLPNTIDSTTQSTSRKREVYSTIVTWEDFHVRLQPTKDGSVLEDIGDTTAFSVDGINVSYEVQTWVNGWGFDSLWHPANTHVITTEPFLILEKPIYTGGYDQNFRVRLRLRQSKPMTWFGSTLAGSISYLSSTNFSQLPIFTTEIERVGSWSSVVRLSPFQPEQYAVLMAFLSKNKAFSLIIVLCISLGMLVVITILHTYYKQSRSKRWQSKAHNSTSATEHIQEQTADLYIQNQGLRQEIDNLRGELLDSEAEIRSLMLLRGYGLENLSKSELRDLELELNHTIGRIRKIRKDRL